MRRWESANDKVMTDVVTGMMGPEAHAIGQFGIKWGLLSMPKEYTSAARVIFP